MEETPSCFPRLMSWHRHRVGESAADACDILEQDEDAVSLVAVGVEERQAFGMELVAYLEDLRVERWFGVGLAMANPVVVCWVWVCFNGVMEIDWYIFGRC